MLRKLVASFSIKVWVFGLWIVFILHDLEEVFTMARFTQDHIQQLPGVIRIIETRLMVSTSEMALAVGLLILLMFWAAVNTVRFPQSRSWETVWGLVVGILLANGLTHGIQAIALGMYTPGCITGVVLELPAALLCLIWLKHEGSESNARLVLYVFLGFPLQLFFTVLSLSLAKVVI